MSALPLIFTAGWASGVNAYAVVLLLGIFGATGLSDDVPQALQRTDVLIAAAVLFLIEAVADKIPYLDTFWDAVHTIVRPAAGAVVAALLAGQDGSLPQLAAGALGGTTALASHLVKAGTRMAINTSPEPASNIIMSLVEDLAVGGIITIAIFHPIVAACCAGTLLVIGVILVYLLASRIRRYLNRRRQRRAAKRAAAAV
ncbi:DUF4126 domain-containing protein [Nocardia sp. NPDC004604]|uniref:DUF4126 domain-containing protein n=1 Tax=Nocardia sp. NPDC004604 TaxID=3157013 RepID=UPI0033B851A4